MLLGCRRLQSAPSEAVLGCRERLLRLHRAGERPAGAAERRLCRCFEVAGEQDTQESCRPFSFCNCARC